MSYQQLVEAHHRTTYRENLRMVAQQMKNPLRDAVTVVPGRGEFMSIADLVGTKRARRVADRDRRNPDDPSPRSRRGIHRPEMIETGEYIDKADKWDAAMDPTSVLFRSNLAAVRRAEFDAILGVIEQEDGTIVLAQTGILGQANEGKAGATKKAMPPAQILGNSGNTGLTMDKLREIRKKLRSNDYALEMEHSMVGLIGPEQEDDLIGIAEATGASLNAFQLEQLREGKATRLMGFNWIVTNRLPFDANGDRMCTFFDKQNVVAAEWEGLSGDIWNDTHAKNLPYMYASCCIDATRVEDKGVFVAPCTEPAG
jgi:hypothetical protein